MTHDIEAATASAMQYLADREIFLPVATVRGLLTEILPPPAPVIETIDDARFAAQLIAQAVADPKYADVPWLDPARNLDAVRGLECEGLVKEALRLKGGWREAIVELEDHCSEPVRLKNMLAAADQLDAWAVRARAALGQPRAQNEAAA